MSLGQSISSFWLFIPRDNEVFFEWENQMETAQNSQVIASSAQNNCKLSINAFTAI